ncbi:759_t:CDS:2 [Entrophospora sp. SA101]|nr:759_t:CDS:2 [Entrophospora sp. SA101]
MSSIFERVCNFLTHSPLDHISVMSVIYQVIEEQPGYPEDELRDLVSLAIDETIKNCKKDNLRRKKLIKIPLQFEVGYEGVCTLRNIEEAKKKESITEDEIKENMRTLKTKLISSKSSYAPDLRRKIDGIEASNLLWWDPLGSRVLSNESDLVRSLSDEEYKSFMEPVRRMGVAIPSIIKEMCVNFVENFSYDSAEVSLFKLAHDMNWKENVDTLQGVTKRIFNTL